MALGSTRHLKESVPGIFPGE